jgi:ankyrin repeat protein
MLKFIIENNYYLYPNNIGDKTISPVLCDEAARVGNVEMFEYLLDLGCNPTDRAINLACCNSKVKMVKYLCKNGYKLESYLWDSCGNKDIKKLLKKYKCPIKTDS